MLLIIFQHLGTTSAHHPYFNNHSPSRFQQHAYSNSPKFNRNSFSEMNKTPGVYEGKEGDHRQQQMYCQPPRTPSKLAITKPQIPTTNLHATSALLASLDKSILQIR